MVLLHMSTPKGQLGFIHSVDLGFRAWRVESSGPLEPEAQELYTVSSTYSIDHKKKSQGLTKFKGWGNRVQLLFGFVIFYYQRVKGLSLSIIYHGYILLSPFLETEKKKEA